MPYFKEQKLLFVHIPKNAGRSIEVALGLANAESLGNVGKRNTINRVMTFLQRATANGEAKKYLHGTLDVTLCAQHLTLQEIILLGLIPKEQLADTRSFAVFRNPYERAVSTFMHFVGDRKASASDFARFWRQWLKSPVLDHNVRAHQRQQMDFILTPRGEIGVDRILSFDNLAEEFSSMCSDWKLKAYPLEHVGKRSSRQMVERLYRPDSRMIIREIFPDDIEFYENTNGKWNNG